MTDLWALDVEAWDHRLQPAALSVMAEEERQRQARFRDEGARNRFLAARLLSRHVLGQQLGVAPAAVAFTTDSMGKPHLDPDSNLHFNLSHSGTLAVLAVSRTGPVGVDVEAWDRCLSSEDIAQAYFAPQEARWIRASPDRTLQRFLALWTLKEACLKFTGAGLAGGLNHLCFRPGQGGRIVPLVPGLPSCRLLMPRPRHWMAVCAPDMDRERPPLRWLTPRTYLRSCWLRRYPEWTHLCSRELTRP